MSAQLEYAQTAATRNPVVLSVLRWMEQRQKEAGQRLAAIRLARGFTQQTLAETAGVAYRTIQAWEEGAVANPRPSSITKVAMALEMKEAELRTILAPMNGQAGDILARLEALEQAVFPEQGARNGDRP